MDISITRRSFIHAGGLLLAGALIDSTVGWTFPATSVTRRRTFWAMGGWNTIEVGCENGRAADHALAEAIAAIRQVDQTYSVFDSRSSLFRINTSFQPSVPVDDPVLLSVLDRSLQLAQQTGGAFDPTVEPLMYRWGLREGRSGVRSYASVNVGYRDIECNMERGCIDHREARQFDPGGWAKGYAADMAVQAALAAGARVAQANCGFDIVRDGPGSWECLIRHPQGKPTDIALTCRHRYRAVATSANTESSRLSGRIGHLMDPYTGDPAQTDLESVSVFAHDGLTADALATALFVMGFSRAKTWLSQHPEYGAVLMATGWEDTPGERFVAGDLDVRRSATNGEMG